MEKLQAALQKARDERQSQAGDPAARDMAVGPGPVRPSDRHVDGRWAALPKMELENALLIPNNVIAYHATPEAMPFDILRTKIQLMMRQNNWKRLAITSPEQGSGKTTLACNLSLGFSRQSSTRTILLDFDLRRPNVARALAQNVEPGALEELLSGRMPPEAHLRCFNDNLAVAMSADRLTDPMKYIMAPRFSELLNALEKDYEPDMMIFDMPPIMAVDETRAMLKHVDCAIIVAKAETTRMNMLDRTEREVVEYCNVLGVVLNGCRYISGQEEYGQSGYY